MAGKISRRKSGIYSSVHLCNGEGEGASSRGSALRVIFSIHVFPERLSNAEEARSRSINSKPSRASVKLSPANTNIAENVAHVRAFCAILRFRVYCPSACENKLVCIRHVNSVFPSRRRVKKAERKRKGVDWGGSFAEDFEQFWGIN